MDLGGGVRRCGWLRLGTLSRHGRGGRELRDGVEGELWISSSSVADGYWQDAELTA